MTQEVDGEGQLQQLWQSRISNSSFNQDFQYASKLKKIITALFSVFLLWAVKKM